MRSRVISLIPLRLHQLKKLFGLGLINLRTLFLKIPKLSEFRRLESSLFHSMTVNKKKQFFSKLCLISKKGILSAFPVTYGDVFQVLTQKVIVDFCFWNFLQNIPFFLHKHLYRNDSKRSSWQSFSFDPPRRMCPVIVTQALY